MKAVNIQVSLNPELAEFARSDSRGGAFDSVSDYVRDLIRRRREAQIAADVALLQSAIQDAPAGRPWRVRVSGDLSERKDITPRAMKVVFDAGVVYAGAGWRGEAYLALVALARRRVTAYATVATLEELRDLVTTRVFKCRHNPHTIEREETQHRPRPAGAF